MVRYEASVRKAIEKRTIPRQVMRTIHNALEALDATRDFRLFDVKELRGDYNHVYYRLRKGKFRAIFYIDNGDLYVVSVAKRDEVYRLWE